MALNSSRITPFRNMTKNRAFQNSLFFGFCFIYVLGNALAVRHLKYSFWWDELTVLGQFESANLFGLNLSHWGNWFPLGRFIYFLETYLFGTTYWAYVLVNATLAIVLVSILGQIIKQILPNVGVYVLYALMVSYLMSPGVLYNVQWGFQVAWFASLIFGLYALLLFLQNPTSRVSVYSFFTLAFLSFGSIILFLGILFFVTAKYHSNVSDFFEEASRKTGRNILIFSISLFAFGQLLVRLFIPLDKGAQAAPIFMNHSMGTMIEIVQKSGASFFTWTLSPLLYYTNSGPEEFQTTVDFMLNLSLYLTAILGVFVVYKYTTGIRYSDSHSLTRLIKGKGWVFLLPTFILIFLVSFRGFRTLESFDHIRYAPAALLGPVIFFSVLSAPKIRGSKSGISENFRQILIVSLVLCALSSIYFSWGMLTTNGDVGRIQDSPKQAIIIRDYCRTNPSAATVLPGISNEFTPQRLCVIYRETLQKSLIQRVNN
jgi:hypothetical protein